MYQRTEDEEWEEAAMTEKRTVLLKGLKPGKVYKYQLTAVNSLVTGQVNSKGFHTSSSAGIPFSAGVAGALDTL